VLCDASACNRRDDLQPPYEQYPPVPPPAVTAIREDDLLQERVETTPLTDSTYRVTFEQDDGQQYAVGARVTVHAMNGLFRTLKPDPVNGSYRVTRCERISDTTWKALRVSLHLVRQSVSDATFASMVANDRR
jgi:hypothetical protein